MSSRHPSVVTVVVHAAALCVMLMGSLIASARIGLAENVLEFPYPEVADPAKQASTKLLEAASTALQAMKQAELGEVKAANNQIQEALAALKKSKEEFTAVAEKIKSHKIYYEKVPKEVGGVPILAILESYKIERPRTAGELAKIALNEVNLLTVAMNDLKFGDLLASRAGVLKFSGALRRALDVGVVISTLADAAG